MKSIIEKNKMKIPFLKNNIIESKANKLLKDFYSSKNKNKNEPLDVIDLIEFLGYDIDFRSDGIYKDDDILGGIIIEKKLIEINTTLTNQKGRLAFTIAHEIGHIILHEPLFNKKNIEKEILCRKSEGINGVRKKPEEVQADMFASFLLMPEEKIKNAFYKTYSKAINVNNKKLIEFLFPKSKKKKGLIIASNIIKNGDFGDISKLAMLNRLIGLKFIKGIEFQKNTKRRNYD